jgi:Flp pilus assembly protein TadG
MRIGNGWLGQQLRRFRRSNDGAAALEFALVLPPLCLILVGMFEVAMLMFTQASMEGALREAARFSMTGSVADPADREEQIIAIVDQYTFGMLDTDTMVTTFLVYDSFSDVNQPEPFTDNNGNGTFEAGIDGFDADDDINGKWDGDMGVAGVGTAEQVVEYTVEYDWQVMTPFMAQFMGDNGQVHLTARVVIRNEPWDAIQGEEA